MTFFDDKKELQEKAIKERKREINEIFGMLCKENSFLMQLYCDYKDKNPDVFFPYDIETNRLHNKRCFIENLQNYQRQLIFEVSSIPIQYDHPLRAARALKILNDPEQENNLVNNFNEFLKEAADSKFYPATRLTGMYTACSLTSLLAFAGVYVLPFLLCFGVLMPITSFLVPAIILFSILFSAAIICLVSVTLWETVDQQKRDYESIFESKEKGKKLGNFFTPVVENRKKMSDEAQIIPDLLQTMS